MASDAGTLTLLSDIASEIRTRSGQDIECLRLTHNGSGDAVCAKCNTRYSDAGNNYAFQCAGCGMHVHVVGTIVHYSPEPFMNELDPRNEKDVHTCRCQRVSRKDVDTLAKWLTETCTDLALLKKEFDAKFFQMQKWCDISGDSISKYSESTNERLSSLEAKVKELEAGVIEPTSGDVYNINRRTEILARRIASLESERSMTWWQRLSHYLSNL